MRSVHVTTPDAPHDIGRKARVFPPITAAAHTLAVATLNRRRPSKLCECAKAHFDKRSELRNGARLDAIDDKTRRSHRPPMAPQAKAIVVQQQRHRGWIVMSHTLVGNACAQLLLIRTQTRRALRAATTN